MKAAKKFRRNFPSATFEQAIAALDSLRTVLDTASPAASLASILLSYLQPCLNGEQYTALTPSTASLLQEYRYSQDILRESLGYPRLTETDLVFCQYEGRPFLPNTVTHNWIKLVRRAGLSGLRLHDARHTHATLMLKQGIHPKIVQERLGHSSIQITLDTYSHVAPGLKEAAANGSILCFGFPCLSLYLDKRTAMAYINYEIQASSPRLSGKEV